MVKATLEISKPAKYLWKVLLDVEKYKNWNDQFRFECEFLETDEFGTLLEHVEDEWTRTQIVFELAGKEDEGYCIRWHRGTPFVKDVTQEIRLSPISDDKTLLIQKKSFTGVLNLFSVDEQAEQDNLDLLNSNFKKYIETDPIIEQ
jgi:hypothetical protein